MEVGQRVIAQVRRCCEVVPALRFVRLRLQLINPLADTLDFVATRFFRFILRQKRAQFVFDVGDCLACNGETLFRSFVFLALERVDLNLELELPSLELVDCFWSRLTGNADAREWKSISFQTFEGHVKLTLRRLRLQDQLQHLEDVLT